MNRPVRDIVAAGPYDTALDALEYLTAIGNILRLHGWEVNVALVSGPQEQITFAAQRGNPAVVGAAE